MGTVQDDDRQRHVADLVSELGELASELTGLSMTAEKASAARDIDGLCDVSEQMLAAHVRYAERYRTLLVLRLRDPRPVSTLRGPQLPPPTLDGTVPG